MYLLVGLLVAGVVLAHWRGLLVALGAVILFGLLTGHARAGGVNLFVVLTVLAVLVALRRRRSRLQHRQ
jgi:MYXO-CTERM domain-containing protein